MAEYDPKKDSTLLIDIQVEIGGWCKPDCENFEIQETAMFADNKKYVMSRKCKWLGLCRNAIESYLEKGGV